MQRYFKKIGNIEHIFASKFKRLSDEIIKPHAISGNSLAPGLNYVGNEVRVNLAGSCLKQDRITFTHGSTMNI